MREFLSVLVFLFVLFDVLFGADARINRTRRNAHRCHVRP